MTEEPMGPQCPNPPTPGPLASLRPRSRDPRVLARPSPVRSCGHRRGPSDSRCPLPRLQLRSLHSGQESPARRPQTAGRGTRPTAPPPRHPLHRLNVSHLSLCCNWTTFSEWLSDSRLFSAPVTRPHAHTFQAVIGVCMIGPLWDQSTTPLCCLVLSLVKEPEGGNTMRPLILLVVL